jgi:hypothetical protein
MQSPEVERLLRGVIDATAFHRQKQAAYLDIVRVIDGRIAEQWGSIDALAFEFIFSVPGIGREFVASITQRDYGMIMAMTHVLRGGHCRSEPGRGRPVRLHRPEDSVQLGRSVLGLEGAAHTSASAKTAEENVPSGLRSTRGAPSKRLPPTVSRPLAHGITTVRRRYDLPPG